MAPAITANVRSNAVGARRQYATVGSSPEANAEALGCLARAPPACSLPRAAPMRVALAARARAAYSKRGEIRNAPNDALQELVGGGGDPRGL
jgi:hypothetical protein